MRCSLADMRGHVMIGPARLLAFYAALHWFFAGRVSLGPLCPIDESNSASQVCPLRRYQSGGQWVFDPGEAGPHISRRRGLEAKFVAFSRAKSLPCNQVAASVLDCCWPSSGV